MMPVTLSLISRQPEKLTISTHNLLKPVLPIPFLLNSGHLAIPAPQILDYNPAWTLRLLPVYYECIHMDSLAR